MPRQFFLLTLALLAALPCPLHAADAAVSSGSEQMQRMLRDAALVLLKEGNIRFATDSSIHPNAEATRRSLTAKEGQEPLVTILSCSDSRAPVERIFDRGVGEIFSVRIAGNVADTDEIATIEYGVGHLHTPVLLVLGHTQCGAVTAVVKEAELHGLIPSLVDNIKPAVERAKARASDEHDITSEAIKENVWQSIADTLRRSSIVREQVQKKAVHVVGAVYNIESGKIEWLGEHPEQAAIVKAWSTANTADHIGHDAPAATNAQAVPAPIAPHAPAPSPVPTSKVTAKTASAPRATPAH